MWPSSAPACLLSIFKFCVLTQILWFSMNLGLDFLHSLESKSELYLNRHIYILTSYLNTVVIQNECHTYCECWHWIADTKDRQNQTNMIFSNASKWWSFAKEKTKCQLSTVRWIYIGPSSCRNMSGFQTMTLVFQIFWNVFNHEDKMVLGLWKIVADFD